MLLLVLLDLQLMRLHYLKDLSQSEKHGGQLTRAAVELAKDWRTDKYLRRLEA